MSLQGEICLRNFLSLVEVFWTNPIFMIFFLLWKILNCCVFQPAFGTCAHPKACWNLFFSRFCSFQSFFSDFTAEMFFFSFSDVFLVISAVKWRHKKKATAVRNIVNCRKTSKNTRHYGQDYFWVRAAPKSWSKYTTPNLFEFKYWEHKKHAKMGLAEFDKNKKWRRIHR